MRSRVAVAVGLVALLTPLGAAAPPPPGDPVIEAVAAEIARASQALAESGAPPHFIGAELVESETVVINGESGGLHGWAPVRRRWVDVDVRVGGRDLDSSHALRSSEERPAFAGRSLPLGDEPGPLRQALWLEIDRRYQAARERWAKVEAESQVLVEEEPSQDLAPVEPVSWIGERPELSFDAEAWEDALRRVSAALAADTRVVESSVTFSGSVETRWFVSSEGARLRHGQSRYRVETSAMTIADDGEQLRLSRNFDARRAAGLPDAERLLAEARDLLATLGALRVAPLQEPYSGPAILSDMAAAVFLHEILGHRVEGHRLKQVGNAQTFRNSVGERILPAFLSVHDDPTLGGIAGVDLNGHYRFDNQGVPAQRVTLVEHGVLRGFLESRSTVSKDRAPNGHGRRQPGYDPVSRQANLIVTPSESLSDERLRAELIDAAQKRGQPYALYVDEIQGGFTFTSREVPNAFDIDAVEVWRVWVDGRPDQLVRGVDLIGTPLEAFSRIRAAGELHRAFNGGCGAESGWIPVAAASPALLVESIETQRKRRDQVTPPLSPPPLAAAPSAAPPANPLLERLSAGALRAHEGLRLPGAPAPHRVVAAITDGVGYSAVASFGALVGEAPARLRPGVVEVVVGSDALDSSRLEDRRLGNWAKRQADPRQELAIAVEHAELALERDLWIATDLSYKKAVQRLNAKLVARAAAGGEPPPPDWSAADPVVSVADAPLETPPAARLLALALDASAALGSPHELDQAEVAVNAVDLRYYTATSEGTRILQPESYAVVHLETEVLRDDGVEIGDELQWVAIDADHLPSREALLESARELGRSVVRRAAAPDVDYYEGPVVFEERAAAQLFRHLLPPELGGTPPPPEPGRSWRHQAHDGPRIGRKLLPDGWSVVDDPGATPPGLAGGYRYDRQGVRGERVALVEDGFVRELLMSRVPRAERKRSTGHARGAVAEVWTARPAVWRVAAPHDLEDAAFDDAVREAREHAQLERILVVRRFGTEREGQLPEPTLAVWRWADGREEPVSLLEFQNVDRRTLRAIGAAGGGEIVLAYLAAWTPDGWPIDDRGLPTVVTAPRRLLVEGMEATFPGPSGKPKSYPRPPASGK